MKVALSALRSSTGKAVKNPKSVTGDLALDQHGNAWFFTPPGAIAARLVRSRVTAISRDGFRIEGLEEGKANTFRWQEWWCRPAPGEEEIDV